jgi:hypothetical protein
MTLTVDAPPIGVEALRMLRKADRVVFYADGDGSRMEIIGSDRHRYRLTIDVESSYSLYSCRDVVDPETSLRCYASANVTHDGTVTALVEFLRPTDVVKLRWVADRNEPMERAGLYHDQLRVRVLRKSARAIRVFEFLVDYCICPDGPSRLINRRR